MTVRNLPQLLQHGPVAGVDAVEGAHRQHGPWLSTGVAGKLRSVVMHSHNANLVADFRVRATIFGPDLTRQNHPNVCTRSHFTSHRPSR